MRSVTVGCRSTRAGTPGSRSSSRVRTCGPVPRFTDTAVGWAGSPPSEVVMSRPVTSAGSGSSMVSVGFGPVASRTVSSGAVQVVRGSPSVAANAEPRRSPTSA
ncbi:Uncharacterised protein [Mycobacteroides abscessus subsp. abscessus]|nr:Uncharacterised protein [Mycobacteroides abscessus subsp. abscessus]